MNGGIFTKCVYGQDLNLLILNFTHVLFLGPVIAESGFQVTGSLINALYCSLYKQFTYIAFFQIGTHTVSFSQLSTRFGQPRAWTLTTVLRSSLSLI